MRRFFIRCAGAALVFACLLATAPAALAADRRPVLAGTWYPADPRELRGLIATLLDRVPATPVAGHIKALIVPHAGYPFSGQIAANAFKRVAKADFDTVVVVAPSHYVAFDGISVYEGGGFATPLGTMPGDAALVAGLEAADRAIRPLAEAQAKEHAVEIEVPFLQTVLPGARLVSLIMGDQSLPACRALAKALAGCLAGRRVLLVASSDLSHFHDQATAKTLDDQVRRRIAAFDPEGLARDLASGQAEACGGGPIVAVMQAARLLGATRAEVVAQATSGDVTGDNDRVVGYLAAVLTAY